MPAGRCMVLVNPHAPSLRRTNNNLKPERPDATKGPSATASQLACKLHDVAALSPPLALMLADHDEHSAPHFGRVSSRRSLTHH